MSMNSASFLAKPATRWTDYRPVNRRTTGVHLPRVAAYNIQRGTMPHGTFKRRPDPYCFLNLAFGNLRGQDTLANHLALARFSA